MYAVGVGDAPAYKPSPKHPNPLPLPIAPIGEKARGERWESRNQPHTHIPTLKRLTLMRGYA